MKYICVVGQKGVGKDTFASLLVNELAPHGVISKTEALATPVKDALINLFDADPDIFYDPMQKEVPQAVLYGVTPRKAMQTFGTDWCQSLFSKNIWLDHLVHRTEKETEYDVVIVTDIRFKHELDFFRNLGSPVIFIDRKVTCFDGSQKAFGKIIHRFFKKDTHISEKGLIEFRLPEDAFVKNDDGLHHLSEKAKAYAKGYIMRHL